MNRLGMARSMQTCIENEIYKVREREREKRGGGGREER